MPLISLDIVFCIVALGLIFDLTNGFHDAANVVSTVIATRVLAPLTAIILAAVLNLIGASQAGAVAHTITTGLVMPGYLSQLTILCAIIGAIIWNLVTWYFGIPSSSSYALIGGLLGGAWIEIGNKVILWGGLVQKVIIPMILSPMIGYLLGYISMKLLLPYRQDAKKAPLFSHLQIASASLVALSHGMNDAQKSMGIITLGLFAAELIPIPHIPLWVIVSCALMMGLGTAFGGFRIIKTVGFEITSLKPIQGFAAESSASCVILAASFLGMPISSTHMIVGSVTGVGAANGTKGVRWKTLNKIVGAWVLTLPGAALVSAGCFLFLRWLTNS